MKKNRLINGLFFVLSLSVLAVSCDDDDGDGSGGVSFNSIASTSTEDAGTITIPLRGGSVSESDIVFGGTATEGEDFVLAGVTDEGVQITITNDALYEGKETIRVQIPSSGNSIHTITIPCDGEDSGGWDVADFAGAWVATEDYHDGAPYSAAGYAPVFVQDGTDPNKFSFNDFWDSGATYTAYVIFDVPNGTVKFPDQTVGAPANNRGPITLSSGTFDLCTQTLTIDLHYVNGGAYDFTYIFQR